MLSIFEQNKFDLSHNIPLSHYRRELALWHSSGTLDGPHVDSATPDWSSSQAQVEREEEDSKLCFCLCHDMVVFISNHSVHLLVQQQDFPRQLPCTSCEEAHIRQFD